MDSYLGPTDPDPDLALFASYLQDSNKKFLCLLLFDGTFTLFFEDKEDNKTVEIKVFLHFFSC